MAMSADRRIVTVDELAERLSAGPRAAGPWLVPSAEYCAKNGISIAPEPPTFFISPSLIDIAEQEPSNAFSCLISAPAAVGKTTLARHLHARLAREGRLVLYVPLQHAIIGEHFFSGLLAGLFPDATRTQCLEALFQGRILLIFDGYDEVSLSSSQLQLNRLFTQEVLDAHAEFEKRGLKTAPCIVFLFRSVFFDLGIFDALLQNAMHLRVDFFNTAQQKQYLTEHIARVDVKRNLGHLVGLFVEAFERRLSTASREAAAFFGHAIVLSAFGDYIVRQEESNVYKFAQRLAGEGLSESDSVEILDQIIVTITERETTKFPNSVFEGDLPGFNGYSRQTQEALLCALAKGVSLGEHRAVPDKLAEIAEALLTAHTHFSALRPDDQTRVRNRLVEELGLKFDQHPFVDVRSRIGRVFRNPIYFDYYLAQFLAGAKIPDPAPYFSGTTSPSHYCALFFLANIANRDVSNHPGMLFFVAHLLSVFSNGYEYELQLTWDEAVGAWKGHVDSANIRMEDFQYGSEILLIEIPDQGVLQNFDLDAQVGEELASDSAVVFVGPGPSKYTSNITLRNGRVAANTIELTSHRLTFDVLQLHCNELEIADQVAELDGIATLDICANHNNTLTLSDYARSRWEQALRGSIGGEEGAQAFKSKLGKILLWFRKHGRDDYAVYKKRFTTVATNKGADRFAGALVEFLYELRILRDKEGMVVLEQQELQKYGVFYKQQNALEVTADGKFDILVRAWERFLQEA